MLRALVPVLVLLSGVAAGCGGALRQTTPGELHAAIASRGVLHFQAEQPGDRVWLEYWLDSGSGHWRRVSGTRVEIAVDDTGCSLVHAPPGELVYVAFDPLDEARLRRELAAPVAAVATGKLAMRDLEHLPPTPENLALTRLDTAGGTCQG